MRLHYLCLYNLMLFSPVHCYFVQAQRAEEEQLEKERAAQAKLQQAMKEEVWISYVLTV